MAFLFNHNNMNEIFSKTINTGNANREFEFERVFYASELYYHVRFINTDQGNKKEQFRLRKDEDGQWKIAAQALPIWVHNKELDFNDIIEENEDN